MIEPLFVAIAAALAGKTVGGLYDLVRARLKNDGLATAELEMVTRGTGEPTDVEPLASIIEGFAKEDDDFAEALHYEWAREIHSETLRSGSISNQIGGDVRGNIVQARDIDGGVSF